MSRAECILSYRRSWLWSWWPDTRWQRSRQGNVIYAIPQQGLQTLPIIALRPRSDHNRLLAVCCRTFPFFFCCNSDLSTTLRRRHIQVLHVLFAFECTSNTGSPLKSLSELLCTHWPCKVCIISPWWNALCVMCTDREGLAANFHTAQPRVLTKHPISCAVKFNCYGLIHDQLAEVVCIRYDSTDSFLLIRVVSR